MEQKNRNNGTKYDGKKEQRLARRNKLNLNTDQNCRVLGTKIYRNNGTQHVCKGNKADMKEQIESKHGTTL
jgi:hypothetical protein